MNKEEVRKICAHMRSNIINREQMNAKIREKALTLAQTFKSVFSYVSIGSEVDTRGIIENLRISKEIFVPYTRDKFMHAVRLNNDADLNSVDGKGNISGIIDIYCDGQAELIFVPLLGFDRNFYRLGYGAGCYDRYFERFPQGLKVGLSFDEQLCIFEKCVEDFPLDMIITPTRVYKRGEKSSL